ncbi:hypothetical protein BT69DRAFT_1342134 [Atractiella rhizophila]|nr:hypothetical protein BT69DRAFT_1342134 [Atractiella rhizophila]
MHTVDALDLATISSSPSNGPSCSEWVYESYSSTSFSDNLGRERWTAHCVWNPLSDFDQQTIQARVTLEFTTSFCQLLPGQFINIHMCFFPGQYLALKRAVEASNLQTNNYHVVRVSPASDHTMIGFGTQSRYAGDDQLNVYLTPAHRDIAIVFGSCDCFHLRYLAQLPPTVPVSRNFVVDAMVRERAVQMKLLSPRGEVANEALLSPKGHLTVKFGTMVPSPISYLSAHLLRSIFTRLAADNHKYVHILRSVCKLWDQHARRVLGPITRLPKSILDDILDLATTLKREDGQFWNPMYGLLNVKRLVGIITSCRSACRRWHERLASILLSTRDWCKAAFRPLVIFSRTPPPPDSIAPSAGEVLSLRVTFTPHFLSKMRARYAHLFFGRYSFAVNPEREDTICRFYFDSAPTYELSDARHDVFILVCQSASEESGEGDQILILKMPPSGLLKRSLDLYADSVGWDYFKIPLKDFAGNVEFERTASEWELQEGQRDSYSTVTSLNLTFAASSLQCLFERLPSELQSEVFQLVHDSRYDEREDTIAADRTKTMELWTAPLLVCKRWTAGMKRAKLRDQDPRNCYLKLRDLDELRGFRPNWRALQYTKGDINAGLSLGTVINILRNYQSFSELGTLSLTSPATMQEKTHLQRLGMLKNITYLELRKWEENDIAQFLRCTASKLALKWLVLSHTVPSDSYDALRGLSPQIVVFPYLQELVLTQTRDIFHRIIAFRPSIRCWTISRISDQIWSEPLSVRDLQMTWNILVDGGNEDNLVLPRDFFSQVLQTHWPCIVDIYLHYCSLDPTNICEFVQLMDDHPKFKTCLIQCYFGEWDEVTWTNIRAVEHRVLAHILEPRREVINLHISEGGDDKDDNDSEDSEIE